MNNILEPIITIDDVLKLPKKVKLTHYYLPSEIRSYVYKSLQLFKIDTEKESKVSSIPSQYSISINIFITS